MELTKKPIQDLYSILEDAKNRPAVKQGIFQLISTYQSTLNRLTDLSLAIAWINRLLIQLETTDQDKSTLKYLKECGFYRILYRKPLLKGKEYPADSELAKNLRKGVAGIVVSLLLVLVYFGTAYWAAPLWIIAIATGFFVGSSIYLGGMFYSVANNIFAAHANLPYLLLGNQPYGLSLLRANNKIVQGVSWGIASYFRPILVTSIIFALTATLAAFFVPVGTFILPLMISTLVLASLTAEFYARSKTQEYIKFNPNINGCSTDFKDALDYICPTIEEQAAWKANHDRNRFATTQAVWIGFSGFIVLIGMCAMSSFFPSVLFLSPVLSISIPAVFSIVTAVSLLASAAYMLIYNQQVDDRYRLQFDTAEVIPSLYLDEDLPYIEEIRSRFPPPESSPTLATRLRPELSPSMKRLYRVPIRRFSEEEIMSNRRGPLLR